MIRNNLREWQYSSYSDFHADRVNLALHLLTVPLFWAGLGALAAAAFLQVWPLAGAGAVLLLVPLVAQGIGHKREQREPIPFLGPLDFASRFLTEQLVTFPRWIAERSTKR